MTEDERTALVKTISAGLQTAYRMGCRRDSLYDMDEESSRLVAVIEDDFIDRLLAAHDLDAALDEVHPKCRIDYMGKIGPDEWIVGLTWWDMPTHDHVDPLTPPIWNQPKAGTGSTRMAAIRNAVAQAQGRGEGEGE